MHKNEETSPKQDQEKRWWDPEQWADYCPGIARTGCDCRNGTAMRQAMSNCFSCCRYFLLFPVILGISFLILGYHLIPGILRGLWMIGVGLAAAMELFGVIAI